MILVTGACGFIGGNIVKNLLSEGYEVLAVDVTSKIKAHKFPASVVVLDSDEFRRNIKSRQFGDINISHAFHLGACANTMETNESIMRDSNVMFSREVMGYCLWHKARFVYASSAAVYGGSASSKESHSNENPQNLYGRSKLEFDNLVRQNMARFSCPSVGFRFFNVYGPGERAKGPMASMPYQIYNQLKTRGFCQLFGDTAGYGPGEQRRDFVHVDDVIKVMKFFAFDAVDTRGIFNLGTGVSRSFNDVAYGVIDLLNGGRVDYVPFPQNLVGKYQMNTTADLEALRGVGYIEPFLSLEDGLGLAVKDWNKNG